MLDLSWNRISSLEGIAGLQSLQELRISCNAISSLKPLRSLPSLVELDVCNNNLTSLAGLEQLPTLQIIHAENNKIASVKIPQTYSHQNKKMEDLAGRSSSSTGGASQSGAEKPKGKAKDASTAHRSRGEEGIIRLSFPMTTLLKVR